MYKKKITFLLFVFLLVGVFIKFSNEIFSRYVLNKLSQWSERTVTAELVDINYFKGKINFNDLKISNEPNFYDKNVFEVKKILIEIDLLSIFSELVRINKLTLYQPRFFFEIMDKFEKEKNTIDNIGVVEKIIKKTPPKVYPTKKKDKNFIILNFSIKNSKTFVRHQNSNEVLVINLSDMSFQNIGNGNLDKNKNFQHYKDIFKIIAGDIYLRIPDMKLREFLKKKYKIN